MKQFFRSIVLLLLVGGWALASASVHVIRTGQAFPTVITKNQLGYHDTYVDIRNWTLNDDRAHAPVVQRLIELKQTNLLSHTVNTNSGTVESQLMAAAGDRTADLDNAASKVALKTSVTK